MGVAQKPDTIDERLSRTYSGLKPHNMIYFSYTYSQLDQWKPNDYYQVMFDSMVIASTWKTDWLDWVHPSYVCGSFEYPDQVNSRMFGRISHSASSLTLSFIMKIGSPSSKASAGFRDIRLIFATVPSPPKLRVMCGLSSKVKYDSQVCQCPEGEYADISGACKTCDSLCSSCFGPSSKECYWCIDGAEWTGTHCKNKPTFLTLVRLVQYTRYLNIYLPPRLRSFLDRPASNLFPINAESMMPLSMRKKFGIQPIPLMFAEYNLHSNFLVNFWGELITMGVVSIIGLLMWLVEKTQADKMRSDSKAFFRQLNLLFKWNFVLVLIAFNIDYIILFASLQLYAPNLHTHDNVTGFIFCLLVLLLVPIFIGGLYNVVRLVISSSRYQGNTIRNRATYSSFYVFFGGYKQENKLTKSFYPLYLARIGIPSIISCALYNFPQAQTSLYMLINAAMLTFIVYKKPLMRKTSHVQLVIQESISLAINICLLILAAHDSSEWKGSRSTVVLGDIIIVGSILINLVSTVFLIIKMGIETRRIWRLRKLKKYITSGAWIRLFGVYIQQGAFGFEEIFQEKITYDDVQNRVADPSLPAQSVQEASLTTRFKAMIKAKFGAITGFKPKSRIASRLDRASDESRNSQGPARENGSSVENKENQNRSEDQVINFGTPALEMKASIPVYQDNQEVVGTNTQTIPRNHSRRDTSGKIKQNQSSQNIKPLDGMSEPDQTVPSLKSRHTNIPQVSQPRLNEDSVSFDNSRFGFLENQPQDNRNWLDQPSFKHDETLKSLPAATENQTESDFPLKNGNKEHLSHKNDTEGDTSKIVNLENLYSFRAKIQQ